MRAVVTVQLYTLLSSCCNQFELLDISIRVLFMNNNKTQHVLFSSTAVEPHTEAISATIGTNARPVLQKIFPLGESIGITNIRNAATWSKNRLCHFG